VNAATQSASPAAACAQCGLPLGRRHVSATVAGVRKQFCCYGGVLAMQVTRARGEPGAAAALLVRLGLGGFFATVVANARRLARR
jgi:hypothetical protein